MTPEAARYLRSASRDLYEAQQIAPLGLGRVVATCAYYAAFHAAEALKQAQVFVGNIQATHESGQ